jgi:hypothetical protein
MRVQLVNTVAFRMKFGVQINALPETFSAVFLVSFHTLPVKRIQSYRSGIAPSRNDPKEVIPL